MSRRWLLLLAVLPLPLPLPLLALACTARADEPRSLTVFAAASLKDVFTALAAAFERAHPGARVRFSFAGTQELRVQLEHGARADLIAAADTKHVAALVSAGLARPPTLFAQNQLVVIVPRDNPAGLSTFADLVRAKRLVIGAPDVPIGHYTGSVLDRAIPTLGADFRATVLSRVVSRELNVKQIVAKVALGEADAAFVYATDARAAGDKVTIVAIPPAFNVTADYPIAILANAAEKTLAAAFVGLLRGPTGAELLRAAGFRLPAPQPPPATKQAR